MKYLYILESFLSLEPIEVILKLVVIYILAGIIGFERASLSKPAGFRTHVLVGISAVLTVEKKYQNYLVERILVEYQHNYYLE